MENESQTAVKEKCTNVFISHSSIDSDSGKCLADILKKNNFNVFFSSDPKSGIEAGIDFYSALDDNIRKCDLLIALITPNYLRRQLCLYEFSVAKFSKKQIVPIIATANLINSLSDLLGSIQYIVADKRKKALELMYKNEQFNGLDQSELLKFFGKLSSIRQSNIPFIGQTKVDFLNINSFCDKNGITVLKKGPVMSDEEQNKLLRNASRVIMCSTTGSALIKAREKAITEALRRGADIDIILPQKNSDYCNEVADLEAGEMLAINNRTRISKEFDDVMFYLQEALNKASVGVGENIGKIRCYCSQTLLRQTIFLCIGKKGNASGFLSAILSPIRTVESPTFAFKGNIKKGLVLTIYNHLEALKKNAMCKSLSFCVNETKDLSFKCKYSDSKSISELEVKRYWTAKKNEAEIFTDDMNKPFHNKVLIEVAAQHPLVDGMFPNDEFICRLDYAINLYNELRKIEKEVYIYVPGSTHKFYGKSDQISLSEAGKNYLIIKGIDSKHIYADEANDKYKGESGVYNSADECFVATQIFKNDNFGEMISVCSAFQVFRKYFFYIEFGVVPHIKPIAVDHMFHNPIDEYFGSLSETIYNDHCWQDKDSSFYKMSREERKP